MISTLGTKNKEAKNRTQERLSQLDKKLQRDLNKLEKIPDVKKREAIKRRLLARYSEARHRIISQNSESNKRRNNQNSNQQSILPQRPPQREM